MIRQTISEWERIHIDAGDRDRSIAPRHANLIVRATQASDFANRNGDGVLRHGRKWLEAQGIVGVIATPVCQLEILPKIEGREVPSSDEAVKDVRKCLVRMLSVARKLSLDDNAVAKLCRQKHTLLEVLVGLFCERVENAVRMGMPRNYLADADDLPVLRGRLNVARQFSVHVANPQRLACWFEALSRDIPINQVIRSAISKLSRVTRSRDNRRRLYQLELVYADVTNTPARNLRWDMIIYDRLNSRWRDLVALARFFLVESHQGTSTGENDGFALLFEMSSLFEEYVSRLVEQSFRDSALSVIPQGGYLACLYEGKKGLSKTKPDLVIMRNGKEELIIDIKWKRLEVRKDRINLKPKREDIFQMMAYQRVYGCPVMLIYPHHADMPSKQVRHAYSIASPASEDRLVITTLDVTKSRKRQKERLRKIIEREVEQV